MKGKVFFLIGPQGCGKSTQGGMMSLYRGVPYYDMSGFLARRAENGDATGIMIKEIMDRGELVPSPIVVSVLGQAMQENGWSEFILGGFPRKDEQARAAVAMAEEGYQVRFLLFNLPDPDCLERMGGRAADAALGKGNQRADDVPDNQIERLRRYRENEEQINSVIDEFDPDCRFVFDASKTPGEIFNDILEAVPELRMK